MDNGVSAGKWTKFPEAVKKLRKVVDGAINITRIPAPFEIKICNLLKY
jgi:hypothetical protein